MELLIGANVHNEEKGPAVILYLEQATYGDIILKLKEADGSVWSVLSITKDGFLTRFGHLQSTGLQTNKDEEHRITERRE
jgi:hypothetical protein